MVTIYLLILRRENIESFLSHIERKTKTVIENNLEMNSFFLSLISTTRTRKEKRFKVKRCDDGSISFFSLGSSFQERIRIRRTRDAKHTTFNLDIYSMIISEETINRTESIRRGKEIRFFFESETMILSCLRKINLIFRHILLFPLDVGLKIEININLLSNNCIRLPKVIISLFCKAKCNHVVIQKNGIKKVVSQSQIVKYLRENKVPLPPHFIKL
jgi:hypothetical protein